MYRLILMREIRGSHRSQVKARRAGNGRPLSSGATQDWGLCEPLSGRDARPQNSGADDVVLIVQPNRSLTWYQSKRLFLFLSFCIGLVGLCFLSIGAWLVLPFTGLEILIVGVAIYCQSCCAHAKEIIHIDATHVRVSNSRNHQTNKCFHKAWLKIIQRHDPKGWYPSRLLIGSHGEYVEVGKNLLEEERVMLATNLRHAIEGF